MKHYENLARIKCISLEDVIKEHPNEDLPLNEMILLRETLESYKKSREKRDFTDMLEDFLEVNFEKKFHTIFVDEAQDLNPLQWRIVEKLMNNTHRIILAGDDDQAIYQWAGADVKQFIHFNGVKRTLSQSYRVPAEVHKIAERISVQIQDRQDKPYKSREEAGQIIYHDNLDTVSMKEGTWLLLSRNVCYLRDYNQHCYEHSYFFKSRSGDFFDYENLRAIALWEKLRRGEKISHTECMTVYGWMKTNTKIKRGSKKRLAAADVHRLYDLKDLQENYGLMVHAPWYDSLDVISPNDVEYIRCCLKSGEKLNLNGPRININTIHGVKGGEADNVVIKPDMSMKTYMESQRNPDAEHRVWYVGITRAKQTLHVIAPHSSFYYSQLV